MTLYNFVKSRVTYILSAPYCPHSQALLSAPLLSARPGLTIHPLNVRAAAFYDMLVASLRTLRGLGLVVPPPCDPATGIIDLALTSTLAA